MFYRFGTFQNIGLLENNPFLSTFTVMAAYFPDVEQPDFIISINTGESRPKTANPYPDEIRNIWKNGAFPKFYYLFLKK
ncbi:hypothetical protein PpBr36_02293 [Pyricularia pennisetigena]|uniref:hypothetical protein n=1 Tax=Pyricularia pennisetigena TaxID=1578925 RepID=UPI0011517876|nr:hypothetical protein PpBr36_02293 [Pyricularia pennisetigena]TLS31093.1 hypothetical protein PpBr36_02293 [Pyricularia pennisetigena]